MICEIFRVHECSSSSTDMLYTTCNHFINRSLYSCTLVLQKCNIMVEEIEPEADAVGLQVFATCLIWPELLQSDQYLKISHCLQEEVVVVYTLMSTFA